MSRRTGQRGNVYQPAHPGKFNPKAPCYGRYWEDIPGEPERKRCTVSLGICRTITEARQKLQRRIESEGVNSKELFHQNNAPATTFREQAEKWIASLPNRRRKPVKAATIYGWRYALKWLLPLIGDMLLADVGNAAMKMVIDKMAAAGLSAQSIVTYTRVIKMVVASAVDKEGEQIYPRKWNHDFVGLPIIDPTKQRRPTVSKDEIERMLTCITPRFRLLVALLAGTGLRIGEALGLKTENLSPDCRVLHVRRSVWYCREQNPKTPNAVRVVDIPESLAQVLREYVSGKSGYLFSTRSGGRPLSYRNVLRTATAKKNGQVRGLSCGFHALRRFRTETLRRARVPEDLVRLWLGHAAHNVTDTYAKGLSEDQAWRQEWAEHAGLGFSLVGLRWVTKSTKAESQKAA